MALSMASLEPEAPSLGKLSPLTRLFTGDNQIRGRTTSIGGGASLKKVETLLEEIKGLPVNKFTEEMRELQVRISFLLLLFVNAPSPPLGGGICIQSLPFEDTHRTLYAHPMASRHRPSSPSDPPCFGNNI